MPGDVPVPHHFYPFAFKQGADNSAAEADAADIFNLSPGDRLPVGNNRQRFQKRLGITLWSFPEQPVYPVGQFRTNLEPETAGDLLQFHATPGIVFPQFIQRGFDSFTVRFIGVILEHGQ